MWSMPPSPVPADPGRDDDLAWLDRDPVTAAEREEWLDRVCEHDEPPEPDEYEDFAPLTAAELAGRVTLTVPLATAAGLAARPGEPGGPGPVDPRPARAPAPPRPD